MHRQHSRSRQTRWLGAALILLLALSFGAGAQAMAGGTKVKRVGLITPASRTNHGWDEQAVENITQVGKALGIQVEIADNAGYQDITPILRDMANNHDDLILCHASGYQTVCPPFAHRANARVSVIENPKAVTPGLISDVETQAQEVAYLAGVLAGKMTKSGTVGVVASAEPPTWNYMTVGFAEGLKVSKPDAKFLYSTIASSGDPYSDSAGAKRVTEQELAAGADIIFGMGDGASFGMLQAVDEHDAKLGPNGDKAWFIDVIGDKRSIDKQHVLLTSVLFDYTNTYKQMIADIEDGTFGKVYTLDVKNGGVRLLDLPSDVPESARTAVSQAQQEIVAGKITVSAIADPAKMHARIKELFPK